MVLRGNRCGGLAGVARSCRSPCVKSRQQARPRRDVSHSYFPSALLLHGLLLSAAKDVLATTRGTARCCRINSGSRRGHNARENALHHRLDAIRERKNARYFFPGYAEAGAENNPHALVVVFLNEREVLFVRFAS